MSWMDSWSRPSKSQATPAPFYLLPGGASTTPYCHSCGRVIGSRRKTAAASAANAAGTPARYCSSRCRARKPGRRDRLIEATFVRFLTGAETVPPPASRPADAGSGSRPAARPRRAAKGDPRVLVSCRAVEDAVFGHGRAGREAVAEREALGAPHPGGTGDAPPADEPAGSPPQAQPEDPGPGTHQTPPEGDGTEEDAQDSAEDTEGDSAVIEKRRRGQKRAQERELVRCAARRGVVFGFLMPVAEESTGKAGPERRTDAAEGGERRLCEAVMAGKVVEPSFAKGDWGIRWRE